MTARAISAKCLHANASCTKGKLKTARQCGKKVYARHVFNATSVRVYPPTDPVAAEARRGAPEPRRAGRLSAQGKALQAGCRERSGPQGG